MADVRTSRINNNLKEEAEDMTRIINNIVDTYVPHYRPFNDGRRESRTPSKMIDTISTKIKIFQSTVL
jgi:hypothetical protein